MPPPRQPRQLCVISAAAAQYFFFRLYYTIFLFFCKAVYLNNRYIMFRESSRPRNIPFPQKPLAERYDSYIIMHFDAARRRFFYSEIRISGGFCPYSLYKLTAFVEYRRN
jgi:hypothetical protein